MSAASGPRTEAGCGLEAASGLVNLALRKPATQSSISEWSRGASIEEDAAGANNGEISAGAGFHTAQEDDPWWQVDLGAYSVIRKVVLYNRVGYAERLKRFRVLKSLDGRGWETIYRKADDSTFGNSRVEPFEIVLAREHLARYIRVQLDGFGFLHFNECQVLGVTPDAGERQRLLSAAASELERLRSGRNGTIIDLAGVSVFVDVDRYAPGIVHALMSGSYEFSERRLTSELLRPDDRVIEIGTAIGAVAMTAAAIVGPENILTFEANPHILEDAKRNFAFNGVARITARNGVIVNRRRLAQHPPRQVPFHISTEFWKSRLHVHDADTDIIGSVTVPEFCLEDEIRDHGATALICDIEGGEVPLLTGADLAGIRLIIMETHYWSAGVAETDAMVRRLTADGFDIDLARSAHQVIALRRSLG